MTTYVPQVHARRPHVAWPLFVAVGLLTLVLAGVAGYVIAGGFTSESSAGQDVSDRVMHAWATGDTSAIRTTYAPDAKVILVYSGTEDVIASNRADLSNAIRGAIDMGNTYEQVGPVATYAASDGDLYVSSLVEVVGPGHPGGVPAVGFYRVRDGKVVRHVFLDAEHY